jgi:hypothetical protein
MDSDDRWESFLNPADGETPEDASLEIAGQRLARGCRVRLEPTRAADVMDLYLRGKTAIVTAVYCTLENEPYVAVVLDEDPLGEADPAAAADIRYRRALFFRPDEVVPIPHAEITTEESRRKGR